MSAILLCVLAWLVQLWDLDRRVTEGLERSEAGELQELERSVKARGGRDECVLGNSRRARVEALALLVLGAAVADHVDFLPSADDLAAVAHALHGRADLHGCRVAATRAGYLTSGW